MAFYNIYSYSEQDSQVILSQISKGDKGVAICDLACVKNGFTWWHSLFYINSLGLALKKRYSVALVMLLVSFLGDHGSQVLIKSLDGETVSIAGIVVRLLMMLLMGIAGNSLVEGRILSKGGQWLGSYWAKSEDEAMRKFYGNIINGTSVATEVSSARKMISKKSF